MGFLLLIKGGEGVSLMFDLHSNVNQEPSAYGASEQWHQDERKYLLYRRNYFFVVAPIANCK